MYVAKIYGFEAKYLFKVDFFCSYMYDMKFLYEMNLLHTFYFLVHDYVEAYNSASTY